VRGIADELAAAERELLINATYQDAARERERVEFLAQGLVDGVQHLIDLGHRRIAYIRGEDDLESTHQRYRAYADGLQLAGIAVDERLVASCDFSYNGGFRTAARLIADHGPTAVVAGADLIAFGAIDAARAHGLDVPSQCSVIGFDDLPQAAQSFPGHLSGREGSFGPRASGPIALTPRAVSSEAGIGAEAGSRPRARQEAGTT